MYQSIFAAAMLAGFAAPAFAAAPVISGNYVFTFTEICQANIPSSSPGTIQSTIAIANFNPTAGTVSVSGSEVDGDLVVLGGNGGLTSTTLSQSFPYSNTGTTFTLNGTTLNAVYGKAKKTIAQNFIVGGVVNSTCSVTGSATRK